MANGGHLAVTYTCGHLPETHCMESKSWRLKGARTNPQVELKCTCHLQTDRTPRYMVGMQRETTAPPLKDHLSCTEHSTLLSTTECKPRRNPFWEV